MRFLGEKVQQEALSALTTAVDTVLQPVGFERGRGKIWRRKFSWKTEEIDWVVKGGTSKHLLASFRVLLPRLTPSSTGEKDQYIAQVNVPRLLRPEAGPEFDTIVPSIRFRRRRFVFSVISDIQMALPWFEQFATPELCKRNLETFLKSESPAYVDAEKFLNSVKL